MIAALLCAFVLSLLCNWTVRSLARNRGWAVGPRSIRHIHNTPIPRLGGVGVYLSFTVLAGVSYWLRPALFARTGFLGLIAPASLMFAIGFWDDIRPLSVRVRIIVQAASGAGLFFWCRWIPAAHALAMPRINSFVLFFVTVAWVMLVSNSINLIDGADGLAAGTAVLTLAVIACVSWWAGSTGVMFLAIVLIGSLLGFLRFNVNRATIFLGDGGSLFVGFMISVLVVVWRDPDFIVSTTAIAVAILALPLAETSVSVFRRFISGRPLFSPDREHIHHKLLDRGFSQPKTVVILYAVALVCGLLGLAMAIAGPHVFPISFLILTVIIVLGLWALGYVEFLEIGRIVRNVSEQRDVLAHNVELRKLVRRLGAASCIGQLANDIRVSLETMRFDGMELWLEPDVLRRIHCDRPVRSLQWGIMAKNGRVHPVSWTMEMELYSERHGRLGWLRLSSMFDRGDLLLDAKLLVTELKSAIVASLERCLTGQCDGSRDLVMNWTNPDEDEMQVASIGRRTGAVKDSPLPLSN